VPLEHFEMAAPDETEAQYRRLWRRFYDTIAIRERENPRLRMSHMPRRFWGTMTEFQEENATPVKASSPPAGAQGAQSQPALPG
ncbi:MAG: DUF4130 domain-containing protein, partial [Oscillospiraceae bacterium]|nr:DUF4130 domain-containing protein [Oscillospiraceae bacterium]